jgi:hypothetical protein
MHFGRFLVLFNNQPICYNFFGEQEIKDSKKLKEMKKDDTVRKSSRRSR